MSRPASASAAAFPSMFSYRPRAPQPISGTRRFSAAMADESHWRANIAHADETIRDCRGSIGPRKGYAVIDEELETRPSARLPYR